MMNLAYEKRFMAQEAGERAHEEKNLRPRGHYGSKAALTKQLILLFYALISLGFGIAGVCAPQQADGLFAVWLLITFSLWLYLFLTMIRLLCDLQSLQKMREELYELRYQELTERLAKVRAALRKSAEKEKEEAL